MAQHDYVIANGTGAAVRSDLNNALAAIVSNNSGATEPATMYAYQWWADTSTGLLKLRNAANNAWITLRELDGTLTIEAGTVSAPGLAFASDLNTGIYSPSADQLAIATNGVERVEWGTSEVVFNDGGANYDFRIEGDTVDSLFFVDASTDRVGLGTSSPSSPLHILSTVEAGGFVERSNADVRFAVYGGVATANLGSDYSGQIGWVGTSNNYNFGIKTNATTRLTVDTSGRVGIGITPDSFSRLHVSNNGAEGFEFQPGTVSANVNTIFSYKRSTSSYISLDFLALNHVFRNTGGEAARFDNSGRLLVGTSTSRSNFFGAGSSDPRFQVEGTDFTSSLISNVRNSANASPPHFVLGKSRGASLGSYTVVSSGDALGLISFQGADGTNLVPGASIYAEVDGTPGTNDMPGRLVFSTTADGASSPTRRFQIAQNGQVNFANLTVVLPETDNAVQLGGGSFRFTAVYAVNGTIQTSDKRAKTDINEAQLGSDFIKSLRPVSYKWIEGGNRDTGERDENNNYIYEAVPGQRTHWGFVAQEVKEAVDAAGVDFGGWVLTDKDDPDSQQALRYDQFIAPLTKALQEALQKIEVLEQRLADAGIA